VACSEAGVEAIAWSGAATRRRCALGLGSRTAGGGGGTMVARVTVERERVWGQKFAKCGERERGA
jgi:hypothetical protein